MKSNIANTRELNVVYESRILMIIEDYDNEKLMFICKNRCSEIYFGFFSFDLEDIERCFNEVTIDLDYKEKDRELNELKDSDFYKETQEWIEKE